MAFRIPILPVYDASVGVTSPDATVPPPTVLDGKARVYLDSGSSAIGLAFDLIGLGPRDEVLMPAYHCPTMVTPAAQRGANVRFYGIQQDATISPKSIEKLISSRSAAILVPHFFGILQDLSEIRSMCDQFRVSLIEDCAHSFFGGSHGQPVGSVGEYAIASTRKFFPGADGGCLISRRGFPESLEVQGCSALAELRLAVDVLEESALYGRAGLWRLAFIPAKTARSLLKRLRSVIHKGRGERLRGSEGIVGAGTTESVCAMSRVSRFLLARSDTSRICRIRRRNFQHIRKRLAGIPGLKCLPNAALDGIVPYMYPLLSRKPSLYHALRDSGWPVWRWDDSDPSCEVTRYYSQHLLQLPCHQSLTINDLDAIADAVVQLNEEA